jgi:two-component system cell cycle response regulator DivK
VIVEDNELNMKLFHDLLEAHGYHPIGTSDGIGALDLARKHRPDLILMDIQLPEVSGLEVTKWLKEDRELKAIPVVAVTAFAMKGDEERIRQRRLLCGLAAEAQSRRSLSHRRCTECPNTPKRPDCWPDNRALELAR